MSQPTTLHEAQLAVFHAKEHLADLATNELTKEVKDRYPDATAARVTAILSESYTEHDIEVLDAEGNRLNTDDWPHEEAYEDWLMEVTEGVCAHDELTTVLIE